jgi:hypothetical protein
VIAMIEALLDRDPSSPAIWNIQRYHERGPEALGAVTCLLAAWLIRAWTEAGKGPGAELARPREPRREVARSS